jgi:hypothetical protein
MNQRFRALHVEEVSRVNIQMGSTVLLPIILILLFTCAALGKSSWEVVFAAATLCVMINQRKKHGHQSG